nr:hypothetical protein CFP56_28274 [Quercus suber]
MVFVQRVGEQGTAGLTGARQAEREQQVPPQTTASAKQSQVSAIAATTHKEANVEDLILGSTRIMEKQTGDKGKDDFENLLREIDAEISGKVDTECNVDTADSERIMEEVMGSAQQKEAQQGEVSTQGLGSSCSYNGPQALMGHLEDQVGSGWPKSHTYTNAGFKSFSRWAYEKKNEMEDVSRMEVEELDMGPKRKLRAPLSEVMDNREIGKKLKLDEEVFALGKLMATQMGSAAAAGQPRREQ